MASLVERDAVPVMFVEAKGGISGASAAFENLERRFPSLRGRKFFATVQGEDYRACVATKPGDDPRALRLRTSVIPGGLYARARLRGGPENIGPAFEALSAEHPRDASRPVIEFYRRHDDIILFFPVNR